MYSITGWNLFQLLKANFISLMSFFAKWEIINSTYNNASNVNSNKPQIRLSFHNNSFNSVLEDKSGLSHSSSSSKELLHKSNTNHPSELFQWTNIIPDDVPNSVKTYMTPTALMQQCVQQYVKKNNPTYWCSYYTFV